MREGPLAALFRSTEQQAAEEATKAQEPASAAAPASPQPEAPETDEVPIPSPQERLRHAFSADIPENVMSPSTPAARERPRPESQAAPAETPEGTGAPVLRVVGVGGAGVNAINRMIEAEVEGVEFLAINTDQQSLQGSSANIDVQIGASVTRGLGSGRRPRARPGLGDGGLRQGQVPAQGLGHGVHHRRLRRRHRHGGSSDRRSHRARDRRPDRRHRHQAVRLRGLAPRAQADDGIKELAQDVDTLIVVPNNRLLTVLDKQTSMVDAFRVADDVLRQGVQGISDLVTLPGLINLDFADVRTIMSEAGNALLGIGMSTGERRAVEAAEKAVASPLLETSMEGARSILLSITGGRDLSLWEVNEAARAVSEAAHPEANIIFGAMVDDKLDDQVWVTVVATGYADGITPRRRSDEPGATRGLEEPRGEPRISRRERPTRASRNLADLDVPEFIPRG